MPRSKSRNAARSNQLASRGRRLTHESLETRRLFAVHMSDEDQLFLELVNRARADPVAEIARNLRLDRNDEDLEASDLVAELNEDVEESETISADPKQPLAPHQSLINAMDAHAEDMLQRSYFGHDSPEGSSPSTRAKVAGYPTGAGENIAWSGRTDGIQRREEIYKRHRGLVRSVGHRVNLFREDWREIGPAVEYGDYRQDGQVFDSIMVGTLFGNRRGNNFITGVAITDHIVPNNFYEIGEGLSNVTITVTQDGTDFSITDTTGRSGGYSIQVPNGVYTVMASGGDLNRELIVRGVEVNGENMKVDFNRTQMPTRFIAGTVFEDANENSLLDANDRVLAGRTVFVDTNENGELDVAEPQVESNNLGEYAIDGLLPGEYTIRQVVAQDWTETVPFGQYDVPLSVQNIIGVHFGSVLHNDKPVAVGDSASVTAGRSVEIDVLQNDSDADGSLDATTLRIARIPRFGTVTVTSDNQLSYAPRETFSGTDTFSYTVDDDRAGRSNPGVVTVSVSPQLPFQNGDNPFDVNDDGFVVSLDVLLVINELNRNGSRSLSDRVRDDALPYYYDVTGDEFISALDVLRIIQFINQRTLSAQGEPPAAELAGVDDMTPPAPSGFQADMFFALAMERDDEEDEAEG